jgi:hypothetical protein
MTQDPIVNEVREAGARLASEAGNDVHRFFEKLRQSQKNYGKPLVRKPVPRYESTGRTP